MKTLKGKIIALIVGLTVLLCGILAIMNVSLNISTANGELFGSVRNTILLNICVSIALIIAAVIVAVIFAKKVLKPVDIAALNMSKMAKGEMIEALDETEFQGEFRPIAESFNGVRTALNRLSDDTDILAEAAMYGDFFVRADDAAHNGRYKSLIEGINQTINTFVSDFDAVPSPIMAIDKDFTIRYMNEAGAKVSGKRKEELVGMKCYDIFCTGDCNTENCACMKAMRDKMQHEHEVDAHPAGANLEIRYMGTPIIKDGEVVGAFEVVTDLTDIKNAQKEAQDQATMLTALLNDVNEAAIQVSAGAGQVSEGSQAISQGATEQAGAIEELTATVTQIAEQTRQNAMSAGKANELTASAKQGAAEGNEQMQDMQQAMDEINEASANISKIIKVIDDIAFQTNILALNAAVEAARAGVHGKGFAVVAEEVRNLAARSANAAKETTALIEGSIRKTEAGTEIANKTAATLAGIVEGVEKAAELTGQIATASDEQATGIAQVNNGIEQLSQVVQTNSATSEEAAASAEELSSQAETLTTMVGRFNGKEDNRPETPETGRPEPKVKEAPAEPAKPRIVLNDNEFGKY